MPAAPPAKTLARSRTARPSQVADFARRVAEKVLSRHIVVKFCATPHHLAGASYGPTGELVFNEMRLGAAWFQQGITDDVVRLLIHELGKQCSPTI